jgi:hypothetical protein
MAQNNQNESALPTPGNNKRASSDLLPRFFRTEANKKFLQSTLDQLIQPGVAEKINSFFGRTISKAYNASDNYIKDVSSSREAYQLEPAVVIKDDLDNVTFYKDYNDYINQLTSFGSNTEDHSKLNSQMSYPWNPHIDWDKFVNFREYYWMPTGPLSVPVRGQAQDVVSTYTVTLVDNGDNVSYLFTPDGKTANPTLKLYRGQTYRFEINTPEHPMAFAISRSFTPGNAVIVAGSEGVKAPGLFDAQLYGNDYDTGEYIVLPSSGSVTFDESENVSTLYPDGIRKLGEAGEEVANVYIENGVIEFTIPMNAPNNLFYISRNDVDVSGRIKIYDIEENTFLDVESEIIGKKTYKSANGIELSNGMKVEFQGNTSPSKYENGYYYVEGVGSEIVLINENDLVIPAAYQDIEYVPYGTNEYDILPFANSNSYPGTRDYLIINRASRDRNPWTRYNRWFHRDIIEHALAVNNQPVAVDENHRARRPIIEFEAGLWLYNYGTQSKADVDLIDTSTTDVFSTIEGKYGYIVDGVELAENMRVLFAADTDILVSGKIYTVKKVTIGNDSLLSLVETEDADPVENEVVFVKQGSNAGKTYHYRNGTWTLAQEKTKVNQPPLFDLCCPQGNQYSDTSIFDSSTFKGTKIFSYKEGNGTVDTELGFPLSYRNLSNTGDIVFEFNLLTDTFSVQVDDEVVDVSVDTSNLRKYKSIDEYDWVNAWNSKPTKTRQKVLRQYVAESALTNNFEIDVYNNAGELTDLKTYVFVNNTFKIKNVDYDINRINKRAYITFNDDLNVNDILVIKTESDAPKNNNGHYEIPLNHERNSLNDDVTEFTLGSVIDHVNSMIEDIPGFNGTYPGISNIRDLGNLNKFGKRFIKHSGPTNLPLYHITNKKYNIINAIEHSKNEYARFKRNFAEIAATLGFDGPVKVHADKILTELNKDKVKTQPFYFSDMLPIGNLRNKIDYEVLDPRNPYYALSAQFDLNNLSATAVLVYLNGKQLVHSIDYTFSDDGFVLIDSVQKEGDTIEIYEYSTTDGSYVPPTPTKLGLYPKYQPEIIIDDTFISIEQNLETGPFKMYGELDTFSEYAGSTGWVYPLYTSKRLAERADDNSTSVKIQFKGLNRIFYVPASSAVIGGNDTSDYEELVLGIAMIQGHDGSLTRAWKDYRDDLFLEIEKRIFNNIKQSYNTDLLDISTFIPSKFRKTDFTRTQINNSLLKDFTSWLRLVDNDYTLNDFYDRNDHFTFNYSKMNSSVDGEYLPGFWRGVFREAYDTDRPHTHPWEMLGFTIKPTWWNEVYGPAPYTGNNLNLWNDLENGYVREPGKQIRVKSNYVRPGLTNIIPVDDQGNLKSPIEANYAKNPFFRNTPAGFVFGDVGPVESAWRKSSEYPFAILRAWVLNKPAMVMGLGFDISRISKNLAGQYVYSDSQKHIRLDSLKMPNTTQDNTRIITSGLVNYIYNLVASNILSVYDDYRTDVASINSQLGFKIGGFTDKSKFKLILDSRTPLTTQENNIYVPEENYQIFLNTSSPVTTLIYSGVIVEKQPGGFIIRGYNDSTSYFEYYKPKTTASDIVVSVGGISESTVQWQENKEYYKGQVVEDNFSYYRVTSNFTSGSVFDTENLVKLPELPIVGGKRSTFKRNFESKITKIPYGTRLKDSQEVVDFLLGYEAYLKSQGMQFDVFNDQTKYVENWDHAAREFLFWTTQGWAAGTTIALSPASKNLILNSTYSVVDDIFDEFYNYGVLKSDGRSLPKQNISIFRDSNTFDLKSVNTDDGIYNLAMPLVQTEHVLLLDNTTVFNDLIYDPSTGYRQERIKVLGYRSDNWDGGLNIPGFVYDSAEVTQWTSWKDYNIGDLVKYKQFYYVAIYTISGSEEFNPNYWYRLNEKPESKLYTNFDYKINQFGDFYDLDSDNFDAEQQRMAQHLIGYQKRNYLANIITDDVSQYKFYQGFIQDKGTKNAITKLFDPLSSANKDSIEFYEDWAIQVGRYGATTDIEQVEYILDEEKIKESPQSFELVQTMPTEAFDKIYRIKPDEVYDKPEEYDHSPFPTTTLKEYVVSGGYVHDDDVEYKAGSIDDLNSGDINQLSIGEYIWLTYTAEQDWKVYQIVKSIANAISFIDNKQQSSNGKPLFTLTIDKWAAPILNIGDIIAVKGAQDFSLNGMYKIYNINGAKVQIELPVDNSALEFDNEEFVLLSLRNVRTESLSGLNSIVQESVYDGQTVWVDNYKDNLWGVFKDTPVYTQNTDIKNSVAITDDTHRFGEVIDVTNDNNNLFLGIPLKGNGEVYHYRRTRDVNPLTQDPEIKVPEDLFDTTNARFGNSVSVSEDGSYLAIGIPSASNIKTKFTGDFNNFGPGGTESNPTVYVKGDIVKYRETLWKANREILPQIGSQPFSTFDTYVNIANATDADSTSVRLLVAGNSGLPETRADHILVRAPKDMYLGTQPGDSIKLYWNIRSYAYPTLDNYYPFDQAIPEIDVDFINSEHEIQEKIDHIFKLPAYLALPEIGDLVTTDTGSGEVVYVESDRDAAVIYINNTTGIFDISGELYLNGEFISLYSEEDTYNLSDALGGFWKIAAPLHYNGGSDYDTGRGLVYVDVLTASTTRQAYEYYNVQSTVGEIGSYVTNNNRASFITHLSYFGDAGGIETQYQSNKWVARVSSDFDETVQAGLTNIDFRLYDLDNRTIDVAASDFTYDILNKNQTIVDLWDGYIDFEYTEFDFQGNVYEPAIGDILEDIQTPFDEFGGLAQTSYSTSTAEVIFYQRNFNTVRVYVKNITGNWLELNNIGRIQIRRKANAAERGAGDVDRTIGTIDNFNNSVVLDNRPNSPLGKLLVFEASNNFDATKVWNEVVPIVDEEYWFFKEETNVPGAARDANPPSSLSKDYTQVYNISADVYGTSSGLTNEGAVAVYNKISNGTYSLITVLSSEHRGSNRQFGEKVKFTKQGNLYTLLISSAGDGSRENPGSIEIFRHGYTDDDTFKGDWRVDLEYSKGDIVKYDSDFYVAVNEISTQTLQSIFDTTKWIKNSWKVNKDENYRGTYNSTESYVKNSVVNIDNRLYKAKTNIPANATLKLNDWAIITDSLDYLGYLPNLTNNAFYDEEVYDPADNISKFSHAFDTSADGNVLVVVSTLDNTDSSIEGSARKQIIIYRLVGNKYSVSQIIDGTDSLTGFADSVSINPQGTVIAISEPLNDDIKINQGKVHIYKQVDGEFVFTQTLESPNNEESEQFGSSISFGNDNLVVSSLNGDMKIPTTFDLDNGIETTFDNGFTMFNNVIKDTGVVYVYENIEDSLVFSESFRYSSAELLFGETLLSNNNHVYVGIPRQRVTDSVGTVINYRKGKGLYAWNRIRELVPPVDVSKLRGAFLYNKRQNQIVTYLDYIDPIQGKIAGPAEQEITHKVGYDPAKYNISTYAGLDTDAFWAEEHVGEVWWNLSTARFVYPYQGDIQYQKAHWNELQPGASIDVYEWVESDLLPSQWDETADTELGMKTGISGNSVYGDSQYSRKYIYDDISQTFKSKYYFWVERKLTIPDVENRSLSVYDIARLIAQPREQGYRFISFAGDNRFILNNCDSLIYNDDIVLNVRYSTGSNPSQNLHNAYYLMSDGLSTSSIHPEIERKWIDSLIGYDNQSRPVPNPNLTVKQKYGVQNRPRQSMFVNRFEALKQVIERINVVLKENIIVDNYDISLLQSSEQAPSDASNEYDVKIETIDEIRFVSTNKVSPAKLVPVISNGKITNIQIADAGRGYKVPPNIEIYGSGTDAEVEAEINSLGQIVNVNILNSGKGYDNNTLSSVRSFTVLVTSDSDVLGKWALYSWDSINKEWLRKSIQDYDVSRYWNYVNWYADGYNEFTTPDFVISHSNKLQSVNDRIGDIVKIENIGSGGWLLLRKIANEDTEDYTINYETIGRENGTIQFTDSLYDYSKNTVGYDNRSFDSYFYDNNPANELRLILKSIKENIFINTLKAEYNQLFLASLRYVFSEQPYVDWAFKTSFVKAKHNLGLLEQDVTFNTNTIDSYRSYIEEVKPYKTVIREFVSSYEALDNTNSSTTDFDNPPAYDTFRKTNVPSTAKVLENQIVDLKDNALVYPRKHWTDNNGYKVTEIRVTDVGAGYTYKPVVKITGGGGSGATAEAYLGYGKVTKIRVTNPGTGYITAPTVEIQGSIGDTGSIAKATAILGSGVVRTPSITIKFDRVSGNYFIETLEQIETFTGTNLNTKFDLEWPMDLRTNAVTVYIDGEEQLRSTYTYKNVTNTDAGYTRSQGQIEFVSPPAYLAEIEVQYKKPLSMLTAADRINHGYNPLDNMFGKDLSQLMTGIDYGGVEITSFDFGGPAGWDTDGWYTDTWDKFDNSYEDYVFTFDGSTTAVELPEPFENGIVYNVYLKRSDSNESIRIDDPNYGTGNTVNNPNALMQSITGDGVTTVLDLGANDIVGLDNDVLIVRKNTSDGSFIPDPESYDTELSGGSLAYSSAKGVNAEEIVVDGDGFATPFTSGGPEEFVPGHVSDAVDIKVYTRESGGAARISSQNYFLDGTGESTLTYDLGVIPGSNPSVIVKLDNNILSSDSYTINWADNTVSFANPQTHAALSIVVVERTGQDVLDFGKTIADGSTVFYETNIEYVEDMQMHVTVNGEKTFVYVKQIDNSTRAGILFEVTPEAGKVIHYSAFSNSDEVNYSQITKDEFISDGNNTQFTLSAAPFYSEPTAYNVLVKVGQNILNAGYSIQFDVTQSTLRNFELETFQQPGNALQASDLKVFLNGKELFTPVDWKIDIFTSSIELSEGIANAGDVLEVFVVTDGDYQINGDTLILDTAPSQGETIEVFKFSNHNIQSFERINYDVVSRDILLEEDVQYVTYQRLTVGEIKLRKPAEDAQYVWVTVNGELLSPNGDYRLNDDKTKLIIATEINQNDVIDIIHFAGSVNRPKFAFRQFKDMLNRTHFKRMDSHEAVLAKDLNYFDLRIEVDDASQLPEPNKYSNLPGVIFINGERIEYFVKEENTLRQLRRGTLGTGVKDFNAAGTKVYDQGISKTIPYKDVTQIQEETTYGTNRVDLNFIANSANEFDVFVGGVRLDKNEKVVFDPTVALDSIKGDFVLPADFTLENDIDSNGVILSSSVVLKTIPQENQKVVIVRKIGKLWTDPGIELGETQNDIGYFLRAGTSALPE